MTPPSLRVDTALCTGCGSCAGACPYGAISFPEGVAVVSAERCQLCGACVSACDINALELDSLADAVDEGHDEIMVFLESEDGRLHTASADLHAAMVRIPTAVKHDFLESLVQG